LAHFLKAQELILRSPTHINYPYHLKIEQIPQKSSF
jgi:hypothetical protein